MEAPHSPGWAQALLHGTRSHRLQSPARQAPEQRHSRQDWRLPVCQARRWPSGLCTQGSGPRPQGPVMKQQLRPFSNSLCREGQLGEERPSRFQQEHKSRHEQLASHLRGSCVPPPVLQQTGTQPACWPRAERPGPGSEGTQPVASLPGTQLTGKRGGKGFCFFFS